MTLRSHFHALALASATLLAALPALAEWQNHQGVGMKFHVPDRWVTTTGNDVVVSHPPANDANPALALEFVAVDGGAREAKQVELAMINKLKEKFSDVKVTDQPKPIKQHGLDGVIFMGTAVSKEGKEIRWASAGLNSPDSKKKGIIVMAVGTPAAFKSHSTQVTTTLNSIQPM